MRLDLSWRPNPAPTTLVDGKSFAQTSLALEQVIDRLGASPRCNILDLGPPVAMNLDLYRRFNARITIADFYRFFLPMRAATKETIENIVPRSQLFDELVPHNTSTHFDIVLAWDVLNYLTLDEIAWLMENLSRYFAPAAMMLAIISSRREIPASPSSYAIVDERTLRCEVFGPRTRPSPEYSEHALTSRMTNITVESRFQLRNSMVEYLFCSR